MSLTLSREQERFIETQVATGNFETPSQVIDAAFDLLELGEAASPTHKLQPDAISSSVLVGLAEARNEIFVSDEDVQALVATRNESSSR